jgi:hypothetical protein
MKRRKFVSASAMALGSVSVASVGKAQSVADEQHILEWREYTAKFRTSTQPLLDYFNDALIPTYNKYGVNGIGIFEESSDETPRKIYLLLSYPSLLGMKEIKEKVAADQDYKAKSKSYHTLPVSSKPYDRYSTTIMRAFQRLPKVDASRNGSVLELRSYEGFSEDAVRRKVMMFNDEEIDLFYECNMNPVFFGDVIAGPGMPRLTYLLTFPTMEERDKSWDKFINHPEWKRMSSDPKYADTVSDIYRVFLKPMDISQI